MTPSRTDAMAASRAVRDARDAVALTLQAASILLSYPSPDSDAELHLITSALAESPRAPGRRDLERFLSWWRGLDGGERERVYVETFDFGADLSLYLTEAQPRTSRERAAALLELRCAYREAGADVRRDELPDYLPLMLEAAAHAPACRRLLADQRDALRALTTALGQAGSPFALVAGAVLSATAQTQQGGAR
jgi:nitrate reductase molybdenum cofactor assembly chaperone NarJ/NarW